MDLLGAYSFILFLFQQVFSHVRGQNHRSRQFFFVLRWDQASFQTALGKPRVQV